MKNYKVFSVFFLFLMGSVCFMSSCSDDDETLGLIGSWEITSGIFNPAIDTNGATPGGEVTDALSFRPDCEDDNLLIFEDGGVFKDDEGTVFCDTSDPQFTLGTYTHVGDVITTIASGDTSVYTNTNITNSSLTGSISVQLGPGVTANVDFTMTRQ